MDLQKESKIGRRKLLRQNGKFRLEGGRIHQAFLITKLVNLKYKEESSLTKHCNKVKNIVNQLASMKIFSHDKLQALLLLSSFANSWEMLVIPLSEATPDRKVSISTVTSSLLTVEVRRQSSGTLQTKPLVTKNRGRTKKGKGQMHKSRNQSRAR